MLNLTRPRYVMPVHGDFKRMLHPLAARRGGRRPAREHLPGRERRCRWRSTASGARLRRAGDRGDDLRRRRRHRRRRRRRAARPPDALAPTASSSSSRPCPSRTARRSSPPEVLARGVPFLDGNAAFVDELREAVEDSLDRAAEQRITEIDVLESIPARRPRDVHLRPAQAPPDGAAGRRRGLAPSRAGTPRARFSRRDRSLEPDRRARRETGRPADRRRARREQSRPQHQATGSPRRPTTTRATTPAPATAKAVAARRRRVIMPPIRKPTPGRSPRRTRAGRRHAPGSPPAWPPAARSSPTPTGRRCRCRRAPTAAHAQPELCAAAMPR